MGICSIFCWLAAQIPQILKNYHLQDTSGVSIYFLVRWCVGDSMNLISAMLTRQATWQIILEVYYGTADLTLVWQ